MISITVGVGDGIDMVTYLDASKVIDKRQTKTPPNRSRTGYGSKLPTSWLLKLSDTNRWHRVYVICYSNSGSAYILSKGKALYLGAYEP